jgi:hypothetical protein
LDGRLCPGTSLDHVHGVTCGRNAKHSQYYTAELALVLHNAIAQHHQEGHSWWKGQV